MFLNSPLQSQSEVSRLRIGECCQSREEIEEVIEGHVGPTPVMLGEQDVKRDFISWNAALPHHLQILVAPQILKVSLVPILSIVLENASKHGLMLSKIVFFRLGGLIEPLLV